MKKHIILICDNGQDFLVRSIAGSFEKAGYTVLTLPPDEHLFRLLDNLPDIFLVYLNGLSERHVKFFSGMQDILRNSTGHHLYLIGSENDIQTAYRYVDRALVSNAFARPIQVELVVQQLNDDYSDYTYDDIQPPEADDAHQDKNTILIVDDDIVYLHTIEQWFAKEYNVYTAHSAMHTIAFLKHCKVDLILLDYEMPKLSGLELFHMLKSDPSTASIPVIFLSAKDDMQTVKEILAAKPAKYFLKTTSRLLLQQGVKDFFAQQSGKLTP